MQLTIVEGQYIFRDGLPAYRVVDDAYAENIFTEVTKILAGHSPEVTMAVLEQLPGLLEGKIRKCNDYDLMQFSARHTDDRKKQLGEKHVCKNCKVKFYDMHRVYQCPCCQTAIDAPIVTSTALPVIVPKPTLVLAPVSTPDDSLISM